MFEFHVYKGDRLRQVIAIDRRMYQVGRSMSADIVIPDQRVSRKHSAITYEPNSNEFFLNDLNSKLGTYVNGTRIEGPTRIRVDDVISFGTRSEFLLRFVKTRTDAHVAPPDVHEPEDPRHVTSSINIRRVVDQTEQRLFETSLLKRRAREQEPQKAQDEFEEVAAHFYDLSCRLALAQHHQQIYDVLAEHTFATTPADRILVVRIKTPSSVEESEDAPPPPPQYYLEFCEYGPNVAAATKTVGTTYSRSMVRRAAEEHTGLLFASEQDTSASQFAIKARSSICAPIPGRSFVLGCLYLDVLEMGRPGFTSTHLQLVGMYAYLFGLYLERQNALEEKRESERLASAGLAVFGAAHYLKNVLTGLQGSRQVIDLLLRNRQYDQVDATWGVMTRSLDAIGNTIKKMLEFARSPHLQIEEIDATALMAAAAAHYEPLCGERGIDLRMHTAGPPFPIEGDRQMIDDVLQNLIGNAIDAFRYDSRTEKPPPRIVLRVLFKPQPRAAIFEVQDNGPGVPDEVQGRMFDLFFSTKGAGGSGLGLALCQKYVVAHNGILNFTTSPEGTTFRVTLPQAVGSQTLEQGAVEGL